MKLLVSIFVVFLFGCATTGQPIDVSTSKLAVATHADLLAAAKRATDNGYPSRAALWLAEDAKLTAIEAQISACANAIAADLPKAPANTAQMGPFEAVEAATQAVGSVTGISAKTKILCAPMPVVALPILPKP